MSRADVFSGDGSGRFDCVWSETEASDATKRSGCVSNVIQTPQVMAESAAKLGYTINHGSQSCMRVSATTGCSRNATVSPTSARLPFARLARAPPEEFPDGDAEREREQCPVPQETQEFQQARPPDTNAAKGSTSSRCARASLREAANSLPEPRRVSRRLPPPCSPQARERALRIIATAHTFHRASCGPVPTSGSRSKAIALRA